MKLTPRTVNAHTERGYRGLLDQLLGFIGMVGDSDMPDRDKLALLAQAAEKIAARAGRIDAIGQAAMQVSADALPDVPADGREVN